MKKCNYILFAAALILAACSREIKCLDVDGHDMQKVTVDAFNGDSGNSNTKTTLIDGGTSVYWMLGDEIKLFYNGIGSRFTSTNTENSGIASFTGMLSSVISFNDGFDAGSTPLFGLYPFTDNATIDCGTITTSVSGLQSSAAGTFDPQAYITVGKSYSLSLGFYAVCGGIRFSIDRKDITSVTFKGNNDETLAGEIKVTVPDKLPVVQTVSSPAKEITVVPADGGAFTPGKYYYAVVLPVTFSNGFTMTFNTADGKMGVYSSSVSNSVKRSVFATINNADTHVTQWQENPLGPSGELKSGLYIGVTGFNQALYPCPVERLTSDAKDRFNSFINGLTSKNGTVLYYAADKSISTLQQSTLPANLSDAIVVTFTDGLDQGSIMMDSRYASDEEYLSAVNARLCNEKVSGQSISAYAVGIRGSDVTDISKFRNNLKKLSNPESNYAEVTNMSDLNYEFQQIAASVNQKSYSYTVSLTIPGQANGTKVRFTFDNVSNASKSNLYIEGTFNLSDRSLTDIVYHGFTSTSGSVVKGTVDGIFVSFVFDVACTEKGATVDKSRIKQWSYVPSTSSWQINSEFDTDGDTNIKREKHSVAVMLILDCSKSLGSDFSTMQSHAKSFISTLYNASVDPTEVQSISLDCTEKSLYVGGSFTLKATVLPSTAENKNVVWFSSDKAIVSVDAGKVTALAEGTATVTARTVDGGFTATCTCTVTVKADTVPEAVDLGLPSGILWASFNIGATKPEEYGGYYQWAGTKDVTDKSIYLNYSNCPYHTGSSISTGWTKYVPSGYSSYWSGSGSPDNKTVLDPEDDVAHVMLGGKWRMPTRAEFEELYNNCTSGWTTLNGVKGWKFTSKKNGNSIFLPAAGYRYDGNLDSVGSLGHYWSSSLRSDRPYGAYFLYFHSYDVYTNYNYRSNGQSVRPVSE